MMLSLAALCDSLDHCLSVSFVFHPLVKLTGCVSVVDCGM
jgi:hypothetical protein